MERLLSPGQIVEFKKRESLEHLIDRRVAFLTGYQNARYAERYRAFVLKVKQVEEAIDPKLRLTEAVARNLFKLMAIKDEYEVARLHTDPAFLAGISRQFEGDFKLHYHLAPPLISRRNANGELQKRKFGPAMLTGFKLLARLKGVRGTAFDLLGRSEERREERALLAEYQASLNEVLARLSQTRHATALEIARLPERIAGFGHVKARNLKATRVVWADLMARFRAAAD